MEERMKLGDKITISVLILVILVSIYHLKEDSWNPFSGMSFRTSATAKELEDNFAQNVKIFYDMDINERAREANKIIEEYQKLPQRDEQRLLQMIQWRDGLIAMRKQKAQF